MNSMSKYKINKCKHKNNCYLPNTINIKHEYNKKTLKYPLRDRILISINYQNINRGLINKGTIKKSTII